MSHRDAYETVGELAYFCNANGDSYITAGNALWLKCDGSTYSQATYPTLYSVLGLLNATISTWSSQTSGTASQISALTYGNNLYIAGLSAAGVNGILSSTDAVTWTQRFTSGVTSQNVSALTFGNNLYVAGGTTGLIQTSTDGISWN